MTISYDGTQYCGWQIQPNGVSIQSVLQQSIKVILKDEIGLTGSGRTDAGVHALEQVAHFHYHEPIHLYRLQGSLNALLPPDIRCMHIEEAPHDFHARYSAKGKIYHYYLHLGPVQSPFQRLYSLHVREKISVEKMLAAASLFIGTHDFTSFANEAHRGTAAHDSIRSLQRLDIIPIEGGFRIEFEADGFLYKMVRNIMGTLFDVARGKLNVEHIPKIFESKDRRLAGQAAPPHGLFLAKVIYPFEVL